MDGAAAESPNDRALIRLAGCLLLEQHDEWLIVRCDR